MSKNPNKLAYILIFFIFLISILTYIPKLPNQYLGKDEEILSSVPNRIGDIQYVLNYSPHSPVALLSIQLLKTITQSLTSQFLLNWLILTLNSILFFILIIKIFSPSNKVFLFCSFLLSVLLLIYPLSIYSFSFISARGGLFSILFSLITLILILKSEKNLINPYILYLSIILFYLLATFSHFIGATLGILIVANIIKQIIKQEPSKSEMPIIYLFTSIIVIITSMLITKKIFDIYYNYEFYQENIPSLTNLIYFQNLSKNLIYLILPTNYFPIRELPSKPNYSIIILFALLLMLLLTICIYRRDFYGTAIVAIYTVSLILSPIFTNLDTLSTNTLYYILTLFIATISLVLFYLIDSQKLISIAILTFLLIITGGTLWLSFPLLKEIKNPEALWFSTASNNPSNPEPWRYLGRIFIKKAEETADTSEKENLYEASMQCWNEILSHHPEDKEALVNLAKCKSLFSPTDSEKTLDLALTLDPLDKDAVKGKINIYSQVNRDEKNFIKLQKILYNTYLTYLLLQRELSDEDINMIFSLAMVFQDEIFLERTLSRQKIVPNKSETYQKFISNCEKIKSILNNLNIPTLNQGNTFKPPAEVFSKIYKYKNIEPLYIAWCNYEYKLDTSNKQPIMNIGITYAKANKIKKFIEIWGKLFENDNEFWEKLCKNLIIEKLTNSAIEAIEQTNYTHVKKNITLIKYALANNDIEFAKKIFEETKNLQTNPEEKVELEQLASTIFQEVK